MSLTITFLTFVTKNANTKMMLNIFTRSDAYNDWDNWNKYLMMIARTFK